jgi:hypothetical protein
MNERATTLKPETSVERTSNLASVTFYPALFSLFSLYCSTFKTRKKTSPETQVFCFARFHLPPFSSSHIRSITWPTAVLSVAQPAAHGERRGCHYKELLWIHTKALVSETKEACSKICLDLE